MAGPLESFDGIDCQTLLYRSAMNKQRVAPQIAVRIAASLAARVHAAHVRKGDDGKPMGLVHGSIALPLVLVGRDGTVQVVRLPPDLDFCLQQSPEQVAGGKADQKSDIWNTGLVLYILLTGDHPLFRETDAEAEAAILACEIPPPSKVANLPAAIDPVVMRALARDPAARYPDARAMQAALEQLLAIPGMEATAADVGKLVQQLAPPGDDLGRAMGGADLDEIMRVAERLAAQVGGKDAREASATSSLREVAFVPERPKIQVDCFFLGDDDAPAAAHSPDAQAYFAELAALGFERLGIKCEVNKADGARTPSVCFAAPQHECFASMFFSFDAVPSVYFLTNFEDGCAVLTGAYERHRIHKKPRAVLSGVPNQPLAAVLEVHAQEVAAFKARGSKPYATLDRAARLRGTHAYYENDDTR